ncbi:bacterial transcriptional activator domain-containing protein [Actinoallomurus purpureus]|uniref:bacterial transcriptional activator domain-containing protein n=1 Tax=Actinoallomurus purpureus TaxID=478114 RepID=UPI002092B788|nr:bacterial transcriptional activator domain-containing protein [Actinoallomurus purpureus]MCO6004768.1 bacterial transcriptional activator domain-containing protein [Actinoallomurus purpureus]
MTAIRRQPVRIDRGRGPGDVAVGVLALAAIAALLVGVPFALLTFFGSPIPSRPPSMETFTQRLDTAALMRILVLIVWLAWLQLAACVTVEVYAGIRGVGVPARVPFAGGPQAVAHRLVVAALLLFTATTVVVPALTAPRATHVQVKDPPRPQPQPPSAERADPVTRQAPEPDVAPTPMEHNAVRKIYRVRPPAGRHHESLWEIAEKCLGDGRRYREIYTLNKGKVQPDGTRLTMASLIRPGWVLDMPADATHVELVHRGPHDGQHEHGVPHSQVPGGVHHHGFVDTGKQAVEAARRAAREEAREERADHHEGQEGGQGTGTRAGQDRQDGQGQDGQGQDGHDGQGGQSPGRETGRPPAAQAPHPTAPAPSVRPPAQASPRAERTTPEHAQSPAERQPSHRPEFGWPEELAVASLLAAGLLAVLGRRRREQLWRRAFGTMITPPDGEAALAEQALRIGADTDATRLLDLGLRQMSKALAAEGRTLPTVYGVHLGADSLDLWIAPADRNPPAPWEEYDNGQVWRLNAGALDGMATADLADVLAPYPGLVSLGTNDTGRILIDLETAHGLISLQGPDEARRAVLAAVAVELATNRWSDHMRITLVGFGEELSLIAPDRIRAVATLAEALPELESRTEEVRQALAASGADSVLTGRCRGVFGEAWMPHYLIMADPPAPEEAERLVALARTGQRMAAGYLVAGETPGATWTWDVTTDGRLRAGVLGFDVEAQLVPERHYRAVVELFRTAGRADGVPYGGIDEEPAAPPAMGETRPAVDIRLLGPIEVDAPGVVEESRRALCTEVLVHLATHPEGVHPTVLGGAVWPRGVSAPVRDATVARVADWLGRDSRGRPNLYYDERGRIRLGSEVRVDWEMFRWLVWRSAAEPASETAYLTYALDLVRGRLMDGRPRGRYAWLAAEDLEFEATARIADVAHRLVLMRLDDGDARGAVSAARAGLRLAVDDEGLWRDLLRATHATGDHAAVRGVVEELSERAGTDPFAAQMQPETEALVEELVPQWRGVAEGTG